MDELYEYMKERLDLMRKIGSSKVPIDMDHAFQLFHMICYMKQIRGIIEFQDEQNKNGK